MTIFRNKSSCQKWKFVFGKVPLYNANFTLVVLSITTMRSFSLSRTDTHRISHMKIVQNFSLILNRMYEVSLDYEPSLRRDRGTAD